LAVLCAGCLCFIRHNDDIGNINNNINNDNNNNNNNEYNVNVHAVVKSSYG